MKFPPTERWLIIYCGALTAAFAATLLMGASSAHRKSAFDELDVQRINVAEPDGTLRLVISNTAMAPGVIYHGRQYPHPDGRKSAGLIFYNDEGTENGGLVFDGSRDGSGKVSSHRHLSFDGYEQDHTLVVEASQTGCQRRNARQSWSSSCAATRNPHSDCCSGGCRIRPRSSC